MNIPGYLHYDINIYASVFIIGILVAMQLRHNSLDYGGRLFRRVAWSALLLVFLEVASWIFDRQTGPLAFRLNYLFNWLNAVFSPLQASMWAAYLDYRIFESRPRLQARWYYLQPLLISFFLGLVNLWYPVIFTVSSVNVYRRESFIWILYLLPVGVFGYVLYFTLKNRLRTSNRIAILLLALVTVPILAIIIQYFFYGILIIWPLMAMVLIFAFVFLENHNASLDYLTGLFNRRRTDEYIRHLSDSSQLFALVLFDLDNFKSINDRFGHQAGDQALLRFSGILRYVAPSSSFLARFGGDEFLAILRDSDDTQINTFIENVRERTEMRTEHLPINTSIGYAFFDPKQPKTPADLFSEADRLMYQDKSKRKNRQMRLGDIRPIQ
ncbi:MAG: diguanylate cyclase [Spirochaetales bacterium]|nr:diguanylate cyclase [Spirochaetales bacterium]